MVHGGFGRVDVATPAVEGELIAGEQETSREEEDGDGV